MNIEFGRCGERKARRYLFWHGYKILKSNYTTKIGEIDIVAKHKKTIVFVEVKNRSTLKYGHPCESVTEHKQNKIRQVAQLYLIANNLMDCNVRFDVIDILNGKITHIINAF